MLRRLRDGEEGFTLLEVVIAMTIVAGTFLALAHASYGSMAALQASRARSVFIELANAELEDLRAVPFEALGVSDEDPDLASAYPGNLWEGRDAVVLDVSALRAADPAFPDPPAAVEERTAAPAEGVRTPYTVRRWVTWSDGAGANDVKRVDLLVQWDESGRGQRSVELHSLVYPGGLGRVAGATPTAVVTATPAQGAAPLAVSFDGSGSSDPEGPIAGYAWQFGDGATAAGATTSHTYTTPGSYTAVLTVNDAAGQQHSAAVDITVTDPAPGNAAPTASFTAAPTTGIAPLSVTFDASASSDPEGGSLTYRWEWRDGTADGTGVGANHQFMAVGTYEVRLTVTDPAGLTGSATLTIEALPLSCHITAASFRNPGTNATANDIVVDRSSRPLSSTFVFTATTTQACTSLTASLPKERGALTASLTYTDDGDLRRWTGTVTSSDRFNRANDQTGTFTGTDGAAFPISFDVHQ